MKKPRGRPRKQGPDSTEKTKGTRTLDELIGVSELQVEHEDTEVCKSDEVESRSPIHAISAWIDAVDLVAQDIEMGKQVSPLILQKVVVSQTEVVKSGKEPVRITEEDIEDEVSFWKPSIVGYVAGANPPLHVLEGFVKRIWKEDVDRVGVYSNFHSADVA